MTEPVKLLVCAVVLASLIARPARAEDRAAAERYFRAGAKAYAAQSFAAAAADFDEAFANLPLPEIAFSAAQAYRRLYRVDRDPRSVHRAIELYRLYLAKVKTGGRVGDAADNLAEMERELDKLRAAGRDARPRDAHTVERTRLGVGIAVADQRSDGIVREIADATAAPLTGLAATLDGAPLEPYALVEVAPGEHTIAVRADGYVTTAKTTRAVAGQSQLIEIELHPRPARVAIDTERDAQISVDGRPVATAPTAPLELAAGKHVVTIVRRGREPFGQELTVARGQAIALHAPLAHTTRRRAVPYLLGGAGVLALGAIATGTLAVVHDGRAGALRDQLALGNRTPSDADRYDREVTARDHDVTATWLLGGAAIVAGVAGAVALWWDTPGTDGLRIPLRVAPSITAVSGGAGLRVTGSF